MKLYVANLDYSTNEFELETLFRQYGDVLSAKIIYDRITSRSKGFAFVEMSKEDEGLKAIEALDGKDWKERPLGVKKADDKPKKFTIKF
ncbi:UNVERIFIED_CONTAM: hypothetical protein GTU68_003244 [Idotea baltica]|nr:hypothetical protein [Idotea baltica]